MAHEPQSFPDSGIALHMCIESCKSGDLTEVQSWYEDCDDTERSALLTPVFILDLFNKDRKEVVDYLWLQMDEIAKIEVVKEVCRIMDVNAIEVFCDKLSEDEKNHLICAVYLAGYFEAADRLFGMQGFNLEKVQETLQTYSWEHFDDAQRNHLFRFACGNGWLGLVRKLWDEMSVYGINEKDAHGYTALYYAFGSKCVELIEFLLSQKEVNLKDINDDGSNALHVASSQGLLGIVKLLCEERGFEIDAVNLRGYSAILLASQAGHLETVRYLFETSKANIHLKDSQGQDALTYACIADHFPVIRYLCENVDTFDSDTFLNAVKWFQQYPTMCTAFYFFAALSHVRRGRNEEAIVCLEESYKKDFDAFRKLPVAFMLQQQKGYCLEEKAYNQFLLSVLKMLHDKDSEHNILEMVREIEEDFSSRGFGLVQLTGLIYLRYGGLQPELEAERQQNSETDSVESPRFLGWASDDNAEEDEQLLDESSTPKRAKKGTPFWKSHDAADTEEDKRHHQKKKRERSEIRPSDENNFSLGNSPRKERRMAGKK